MKLSLKKVEKLVKAVDESYTFADEFDLIGQSSQMHDVLAKLERFAASVNRWDAKTVHEKEKLKAHPPLFIYGERGTGKELIVRKLRSLCDKRVRYEYLNCAQIISDTDLGLTTLVGYEKDSFTGAAKDGKSGLLKIADGNILFLDEFHNLSPKDQTLLNSFLEYGKLSRAGAVGHTTSDKVDVITVLATNIFYGDLLKNRVLNKDLYDRCRKILVIPPLRERREDIPLLIQHFLQKAAFSSSTSERSVKTNFSPDAVTWLVNLPWSGNVRMLENVILNIFDDYLYDDPEFVVDLYHVRKCEETVLIYDFLEESEPRQQSISRSSINRTKTKPSDEELRKLHQKYCVEGNLTYAELARREGHNPGTFRKWLSAAGVEKGQSGAPGRKRNSSK